MPVSITNVPSVDGIGSSNNVVLFINVSAGNGITGIGWDVVLQTIHPASLLSDIAVLITNSTAAGGFTLRPGGLDPTPGGPAHFDSGGQILKLANYSIPDVVALGDGLIRLEFFDVFDDQPAQPDARWLSGTLYLQTYTLVPGAGGSSLLAIAGIAGLGRRRPRF